MTAPLFSGSAELQVSLDAGVMCLTLQRPDKGNALSASLVAALTQALEAAPALQVRLLVLQGAGRHFCTGFDLTSLDQESDDSLLARFTRVELLLQLLHAAPFTTVAIAHGRTMGAGADLFGACAERWAVGPASFAFPGAAFGLVLGTARLADTVGAVQARDWIESGMGFDQGRALETGFATRLLEAQALDAELLCLIERSHRLERETQQAIHHAIDSARRRRGDAGDAQDLARLVRSAARPGLRERIAAYRAAQKGA